MNAIAASVPGGTSMAGGVGTTGGTIVGAFVIGVINDGMTMCGVTEFRQKIISGLVIIIAVVIDQIQRNLQARMALLAMKISNQRIKANQRIVCCKIRCAPCRRMKK